MVLSLLFVFEGFEVMRMLFSWQVLPLSPTTGAFAGLNNTKEEERKNINDFSFQSRAASSSSMFQSSLGRNSMVHIYIYASFHHFLYSAQP